MLRLHLLFILFALISFPLKSENKTKALYGFSTSLPAFQTLNDPQIVLRLKSWGVNAVFGRIRDHELISRLHEAGIRVYEEIGFFVGEAYWDQYPQSRPLTALGEPLEKEEWYAGVNPIFEQIQAEKYARIKQLIQETPIDGIWLDFIRWPCHWESPDPKLIQTSFDSITVKKFLIETQIDIPQHIQDLRAISHWILSNKLDEWTNWKCQQITNIVQTVRKIVDKADREIVLGLFGVPWREADFDDAIRKIIGQNYEELSHVIDVFSPMTYHLMCGQTVDWIGDVCKSIYQQTHKPILPIIQSMDVPGKISIQDFEQAINVSLHADGSNGVIIFNIKGLSAEKLDVLIQCFNPHYSLYF